MGAATQIQPQLDGVGAEAGDPGRRVGVKFQGQGGTVDPLLFQQLFGALLIALTGKDQLDPLRLLNDLDRGQVFVAQQHLLLGGQALLSVQTKRGLLAKEGGQRIEGKGQQHQQQQCVLPLAHAVENGAIALSHGKQASVRRMVPGPIATRLGKAQKMGCIRCGAGSCRIRQEEEMSKQWMCQPLRGQALR